MGATAGLRYEMDVIDLASAPRGQFEDTAALLHDSFLGRSMDWPDLDSARAEVIQSLGPDRISRIAIEENAVVGWIGALSTYGGHSWEVHPLVVARTRRRQGIGRMLVRDLEQHVLERGGQTLWLGSDDENGETSVSNTDLYAGVADAIRNFRTLEGEHPADFYLRLGFHLVGVLPDANGPGKPDIFFAKRLR